MDPTVPSSTKKVKEPKLFDTEHSNDPGLARPSISVVLPVLNGAKTIKRAIDSILQQTFRDYELLCINNGSTDNTSDLIRKYPDSRVKYLEIEKPNLVESLNFGIQASKAEYIARMDADDWSFPDRLERQMSYLSANPDVGLVSGLVEYVGDTNKNKGYSYYVEWLNNILTSKDIYLSRFQESALPHPSVMFRRSVGEKYGFYKDGNFPEDFELWNRWLLAGVRMSKIDTPVLKWFDSPNRMSRVDQRYNQEQFSKLKALYFARWFEKKFKNRFPQLYVWGNGRIVKKKASFIQNHHLTIEGHIDVKRSSEPSIIHYSEIENRTDMFILSYVNDRLGKMEIRNYLLSRGFKEGQHFYMME